MIFTETKLKGAFIIDLETFNDERGFFALSWSAKEFQARGLKALVAEANVSFNKQSGTLRGMHYQNDPAFGIDWPSAERIIIARDNVYEDWRH